MLYGLAVQFKQKQSNEKLYHFPDQEDDEKDKNLSRKELLHRKLNQRYVEEKSRGGAPEPTEEEKFMQQKENQALSKIGAKKNRSGQPIVSKE